MNWQLHFGIASLTTTLFHFFEERFYDKFYSIQVPPHNSPVSCAICGLHIVNTMQFVQLHIRSLKKSGLQRGFTRDLALPVRRSNQLSYEATDVGSWSFVSSNEPVKNGCEVIYEMFHILNCGFEIK